MKETVCIKVDRFTTDKGERTCCLNHPKGEYCPFLGVRNFGTVDVCMVTNTRLDRRGKDGLGYTIPYLNCIVWKDIT